MGQRGSAPGGRRGARSALFAVWHRLEAGRIVAEMPGVAKDRLNIQADRTSLTIEGEAVIDIPRGMEPIHADLQSTRYSRSFVLSGELETDAIDAKLKDGVLTIRIPKRKEYRPRKIEVSWGR